MCIRADDDAAAARLPRFFEGASRKQHIAHLQLSLTYKDAFFCLWLAPKVKKISHRSGFFTDPERGAANSAKDTLPTLRRSVSFLCVAAIRTENTAFSRLVLTTAFSDG